MKGRLRATLVAVVGVVTTFPSVAKAATVEPIVLTYETTGACPAREAFVEQVRAYTTGWESVPEGADATRTIRVAAADGSPSAEGSLKVMTAEGKTSERRVAAPTCEAVTRALALMVAVAIDPDALTKGPTAPPNEPSEPNEPDSEPNVDAVSTGAKPPSTPIVPVPAATQARHEPVERSDTFRTSVELRGEITTAVVGTAMPVAAATVSFEPKALAPKTASWLSPTFALGVRQSFPTETTTLGGSTQFLWTAGNLRACPLRFGDRSVVAVSLCAEMDLGRLSARARGIDAASEGSFAWLDFQASSFAYVKLTKRLFLEANAALVAPYSRRRFELSNGAQIARAPAIGPIGGLGVGARF